MMSWTGQPSHKGPRTDQSRRASSLSRMNAPFLVPTSSRTRLVIVGSPLAPGLERVDHPGIGRHGMDVRRARDRGMGRLEVQDHGRRDAAGLAYPLGDRMDGGPRVPDLVDDQDALAAQLRIG